MPSFKVDAFLPAAAFAEAGGTLVNVEGRVQEIVQVEDLPEGAVTGFMRPDWLIFSDLEKALGGSSMNYHSVRDVQADIRRMVPGFRAREPEAAADACPRRTCRSGSRPRRDRGGGGDFLLVAEARRATGTGESTSRPRSAGLGELALEEGFRMSPADLASLGLTDGDPVDLSFGNGAAGSAGARSRPTRNARAESSTSPARSSSAGSSTGGRWPRSSVSPRIPVRVGDRRSGDRSRLKRRQ